MPDPIWWNLDLHLAEFIASSLRTFIASYHGAPSQCTKEQWDKKLESIASRLEAYVSYKFNPNLELERLSTEQAKEALREFADIFPYLWD